MKIFVLTRDTKINMGWNEGSVNKPLLGAIGEWGEGGFHPYFRSESAALEYAKAKNLFGYKAQVLYPEEGFPCEKHEWISTGVVLDNEKFQSMCKHCPERMFFSIDGVELGKS